MKIYRDVPSITDLANQYPATELQTLVHSRLKSLVELHQDNGALLQGIVVMEEGDGAGDLEAELGFTVLRNRWNGLPHDSPHFTPSWDALDSHAAWFELTFILSDEGQGFVAFVPKALSDPLIELCQALAVSHPRVSI